MSTKFPNKGLQTLRARETEDTQTGNAHRLRECKMCLKETGPCVAITKPRVNGTTVERIYRMSGRRMRELKSKNSQMICAHH